MILIRQIILNAITSFPDNQSWKFIRTDYVFQNPEDPFKEVPAASYTIDFEPNIAANNNFIGVKIGDLNHSVIANQSQLSSRSNDITTIATSNKTFKTGDSFTVDIKTKDVLFLEGLQLSLGTNATTLSIQSISGIPSDTYAIERDQLTISLTSIEGLAYTSNETLFRITFIANNDGQLKDHLYLSDQDITNEWYDADITAHSIQLSFEDIRQSFSVANNYPNPFETRTNLPFTLPAAGTISIRIFNNNGQVYPTSGIYFYEVVFGEERVRGKLNVIH